LREGAIRPSGVEHIGVLGLGKRDRPREVIVEAVRIAWPPEGKRDPSERNRVEEEMSMQRHRGARVALEDELAAVLRDLAVVHHHTQLARARLGAEPGEGERQVQVTNADLDGEKAPSGATRSDRSSSPSSGGSG
jgi:hypothetical protein